MKQEDILYLSLNLSQLCGIPTRVYKNKKLIKFYCNVELVKDPFILDKEKLDISTSNIYYFISKHYFYYCILKNKDYQIVIGPFTDFKVNKQNIMSLAFDLDIKKEEIANFSMAILSISIMPIETILKSLISYNFILNQEKLTLENLLIEQKMQNNNTKASLEENIDEISSQNIRNSTLLIEKQIESFVENGNIDMFNKWLKDIPPIKSGNLSYDSLRQYKNTFIVSATLISRAAIKGGLDYNISLNMSDNYIKRCELCLSYLEIINLCYTMIKDYINKVAKIKSTNSFLQYKVANYVYNNISSKISLDELSKYLLISKSNLCNTFKKECKITINNYILKIKINESKTLLQSTNKSLTQIALYLGFSSQAHFTKVFKDFCKVTPLQYRKKLNIN